MNNVGVEISGRLIHFCYLTEDIYDLFFAKSEESLSDFIKQSIEEDFDIKTRTLSDLEDAKKVIYDNFADEYPEIQMIDYETTQHIGVNRVWLTKKIRGLQNEN
jgi:hypothetical protein